MAEQLNKNNMALTDNQKWLYRQLTERNINLGSEEQFAEALKGKNNLQWIYQQAKERSLDVGDENQFIDAMSSQQSSTQSEEQPQSSAPSPTSLADNAINAVAEAKEPAKPVRIPTDFGNVNLPTPIEAERAGLDNLHNQINKSWGAQIFEKPTTDMEAAMTMAGEQKTPEDLLKTFAQAWSEHSDEGKAMLKNMEDVYHDTQNAYLQQFQQTQEYANLVSKLQKEVNAKKITPEQAGEELSKLFVAQYGNKLEKDRQNLYSDYLKEAQAALEQSPYQKDWNAVNAHIATDQNKDLNSRIDSELEKRTNEIKQQKQSAPQSPLKLARDIMADRKGDVEVAKATKDLQAAKAFATQAEDMITSVRESKNFFADFGKSFGKTITSNDTWDFGVGQLMNSIALKNAADKADKGEPLTHDEELLLEAAANYMAVSMYYSDKVGRGTKAGQTTAASIPFMLEFMLTSGAGAAMTNATTRGITRFAIRMLGNGARKKGVRIGAEVAGKTLSDIGYAELLTNTLSAPRIAEGTISRMNGSVKPQLNDSKDGFRYDGRTGQQELGEALWNAHSDQFIENYSEVVFGALDPLKDPAKAAIKSSKLLGKMAAGVESNAVTGTLIRAWNNPTAVALRKETRFGGLFEETMEEEVGGLFRLVANTDVNNAKDAGLDIDSQIDIVLGLAPSVLLMNGAGATFHYSKQARDVRKMREYLKTDEERQMFDRVMSESRSGEFGREAHDFIREIVMNNDIPNEAKRQIILQTVDKYKDVLSNDLVQQAQQIKRQDRTARRETAIRERLGHQTNESDGKVYRASIAGNDTENNFIKKGTIVLNEDGTIDKSQSDGYFVVAVTDNDGNTQIKQVPVSAITNIEGGEAAEDMAQAEIEYYNTLDQAHEMFPEGSIVTIPNSNGAVSEVHYDERGNILVDVEGGQQVKFTPQEAIDKLVPIHEETPQQPEVDRNPTPQPEPVPKEGNSEPPQGDIVTFNIAGMDIPFEKVGDQYYMLNAYNKRTGRPFSLQDLQEKGAQPIVAETPQQGEQVDITNPKPIGTNKFGNVYQWVTGKAKEAAQFLRQHKNSYLKGVFHRDDIGDIDLVWGNDKAGLQHIVKRHILEQTDFDSISEAIEAISNTIQNGDVRKERDHYVIENNGYRVVITSDNNGNWILTAYDVIREESDKKRIAAEKGFGQQTPQGGSPLYDPNSVHKKDKTTTTPLDQSGTKEENGTLVSPQSHSNGKGTENNSTPQENSEEKVPDVAEDNAQAARKRGFRMENGHRIDRQQPIENKVEGRETNIAFGSETKDQVPARYTLIDASELQPSHRNGVRNRAFFIDEAQPKERTDQVSVVKAQQMAQQIRPGEITRGESAYTGAPIVNSRGEVVQGNNRSAALREMYDGFPDSVEAYKQFLRESASEFGLTAEDIDKIQNPVLVRMTDIADEEAIRLGNMTAADTESGGVQRIPAKETARKLGDKLGRFIEILTSTEDEEATIANTIKGNAVKALEYLHKNGIINDTQYQSAFNNGSPAADTIADLAAIVTDMLFADSKYGEIRTMYDTLPGAIKLALADVMYRDMQSHDGGHIKEYVQEAIAVYYAAQHSSSEFEKIKTGSSAEDAERAMFAAKNQTNIDGTPAISKRFSNFAIKLATLFAYKKRKELRNLFNHFFDDVQGANGDMFSPAEKKPFEPAVKDNFNVNINDGRQSNDSTPLQGTGGSSSQRGRERTGKPQGGQQDKGGEQRAYDTPSGTPIQGEPENPAGDNRAAGDPVEPQQQNKIFTEDAYEAARRRMHERLNRLNAGLDPEMLSDGLIMAGYHVEKGARKFAEFAREMIREFGDKIRPYLKSFYNGLRDLPEAVDLSKEMDDYSTVMQFDVNSISIERAKETKKTSDILPSAGESVTLQPKKVDVEGLFGALNTKGEAKLSDHIEQESLSSANAEDTQPIGNVTQSKHTKTGEDIWIVKPSERVSDDEFKLLKARAKANNGYYSSFAKNRGFIFKSKEDANNFNNISDEEITTDQTSADTETAVRTAETVVGETATITRDRRDSNRAEGEPGTESIEGGVREPRNVELTPEQANEQVTTRQQAIAKIDNANDKITDQLAVLGFYEADTSDPKKLHESYGYIKTAEAKAVKDIDRLAKQLADDLGINVSKRKTIAKANIAPAGGDISFRLPLENGKELYLSVDVEPNFNNYYRADGDANSLVADHMFWRIEDPQANGTSRYLTPNQNYGLFERGQVTTTYADLLRDIRRMGRDYLSAIPTGTTMQEVAKQVAEKTTRKKKDTTRIADTQSMLDLFGDVAETMNEGAQQEHDEPERKFVNAVSRHLLGALVSEDMQTPFRSILDLRKLAKESGIEVDDNGKTDILLQELVEDGLVRAARQLVASGKYGDAKSKATYDAIVHLYEIQPTIAQRSSNRIAMQQYSTPLPMAFVADMFAYEPNMRSILEPTAGNGMLVFAVPAEKVHANELDETRLANLHLQEFQEVTSQDATEPFGGGKRYDAIIANPPFGSREEREYDGKMIAGLDPQITLNALASMKDSGKAAIIIGGNMEYADNGSVKDKKAFWSYLYDHYNVKGVVDMDGQLYRKQGTTYPTRMILIDGRRSEAEREQTTIYPPIQQKAIAKVNTFDDLYNTIAEITNSNKKTNGTEILRTAGGSSSVSDSNNTSGNTGVLGHSGKHSADDGNGRDGGQRPTDSTGSAGGNRPNDEGGVSPTSGASGRKVSGHSMGGVLRPQEPVHGLNTTSNDGSFARPERTTTDGERSGKNNVGRSGRVPVDGIRELGTSGDRVGLKPQQKRNLTEEKLPYRPHNTAFSLQSVAPAAMVEAMDNTLSQIEQSVGKSIDQFVTDELGYDTIQDAHNALAAEQMDSVAMAIYQMQKGQALIIGDQTGVGKGRQMAALIRWAVRQGKKPIFITQKADLFSDIYRDLVDIGSGDLRPFIFNSATAKDGKGIVVDANGNEIYKALSDEKTKLICLQSNELPDGFDYVLATYSQFNSGDNVSRKAGVKKKKELDEDKVAKATFLRKLSRDNYLFLDESHTAAGESNTGTFFQSIIGEKGEDGVRAVTFASATFAKRPDTMPMYALRTAMAEANVEREKLIGIIEKGGVTLQEIMSRALTESGQMVRRERDMTDVKTDWKTIDDPATTKRAREQYDRTIVAFNAIIDFQDKFITPLVKEQDRELAEVMSTANLKKGTKKFGVDNTPFASKTFNYTKQLMLALKVDAIVDEVEREIKAGRHPVIALESTMESTIKDYTPGETIAEPSFSASLLKGLDNCMQYTIKDDQGVETHMTYTPNELGEEGETAYYKLQDFIRESTKDIFISPLDAIIERLHEKGYRVGELTGRNTYVERTDDGKIVVRRRTDKDKKRMQREFNSGALDVLILNKSASTGISLHASEKFSDQRQRSMIIAQPLSDINDYMQMIGRIDRTGQVHRGYYINLGLPVPAESRFLMMLSTKLKSLNANTTTSQDSESNEVDAPDLLNKYGSQVVIEYLRDNPTIYEKIGEPLKKNSKKGDDKIIHANELDEYTPSEDDALKITGRVALLNTKEQEEFYNDVVRRYNDLIRYLNDTGTNDLKITTLPLRAKTISRKVSSVGREPNGNNPFAGNAYVEQVEMDVLRKPMKANEVQKLIVQLNGTSDRAAGRKRVKDIMSIVERETEDKMTLENERYENAKQKAALTLEEYARKINANEKMSSEQKATTIEQKQQETEQKLADKNRDNILSIQHKAAYLNRMLDMFTVGETYLVPDDLGSAMFSSSTHSIFCGYKVKDNKISASTSFAVFATLDGRRKVEIKLSDISILNRINDHTNQNWDAAQQTTLDNWDKQIPTQTRKEGYIMTGNILQAVADTQDEYGNYTGQLISYTDIDGNIHDGILMPDKWKASQLRGGVPISARLEQMKQGTVVSTDGKVTIRRGWGAPDVYFLIVPKSKSEGGKYFLNPDILRLVEGNNFYTVRGHMQAEVPAQNIEAVLGILSDMGVKAQDSTIEAQYDELDYDIDNLTDAQQLATDAVVLGALDEAGISVERVSEEDAERELNSRQILEKSQKSTTFVPTSKVPKSELAVAHKALFAKVQDQSEAGIVYGVFSANYYHIFNGNQHQYAVRIEGNEDIISDIQKEIQYGTNKNANPLSQWVTDIQSGKGYDSRDNANATEQRGGDVDANALYGRQPTDSQRDSQESNGDSGITTPLRTTSGVIHGYAKDGKIYLTDKGFNPNTPIHEYTHLWAKAMQAKNLQGWQSVVGLLKGTPMWDEVANDPHYSHLTDDNAVASEVLSRYSGSRGAQLFEQKSKSVLEQNPSISAFARVRVLLNNVREALNKFWNWVGKDLFHIDHFDSIEEVADRILYDLTNGTDLSTGIKDGVAEMQIAPLPKKEGESIAEYAKRMVDYQNSFAVDQAAQKAQFEYEKHINEQHSALRKLEKGVTDFAKPIMSFQEYMVKQGAIMDIDSDTYQDIWRAGSRTQTAINKYHRECEEPLANIVKSIVNSQKLDNLGFVWQNLPYDALKKNKDQMNNTTITPRRVVGLYLQAKDCEEALQLGLVDRGAAGFEQNVCLPNVEGYEHGVPYTKIIEMVEDALGKDMVDILWKRVRAAVDYGLDYQIKRGMISEETRNKYKREFYVPQRGWEERDMSGLATDYQRAGGALYGSPYNSALKQAKGRTSLAADPFAYITSIAYSSITSADDNVTRQHLLKFCLDNEELGLQSGAFRIKKFWVVREIDADGNIIGEPTISYAQPTERMYEHDKEINAKLGTIRKQLGELNRLESQWQSVVEIENINDVVREAVNKKLLGIREEKANLEKEAEALSSQLCVLNSRSTDGFNLQLSEDEIGDLTKLDQDTHRTKAELNQHVIYVEHNGQKYALLFKNEQIPNALNKTYKSSLMEIPLISEAARKATRLISATLTQYNPEFAARNYIKDRQTAITTLSVEQGAKFTAKFEANLNSPLLNAAVMQYAFNDNVRDRGKVSGKYKDLLNEYFEHGAQTGYSFLPDLQRVRKDFDKLLKNNNAKEFGKATINMLSVLTEASETSIRFAAYVTARESGMSADAAASLSKELTTNFNRHGEWSNSALMSLYSFMRATINGNLKYLRGFKKFPIGFSIAAAAYYAAGVLCSLLNPNDPDNDIWFTDYVRETNITLGKFLGITAKIPLGHFMVMFYAAGVNTVAGVRGNKSAGEAVFDTMQMASNELLPSWMNFMAGATYDTNTGMGFDATQFAQSAAPSVVSPFVDVWLNRNFMGGRISNEYDWNKDEKDILKYKSGTSQFYIDIANGLYEAVGGDLKVKNKLDDNTIQKLVDVSPSATEHIVEGYSPAIAETILQTAAVIQSAAKGADIAADELPFVRKFYSSYHPERAAAQQYYMLKSRSKDYSDLLKEYQKKDRNKYNSEKAKGKVDLNERTQRALKRIKLDSPSNADIKTLMELNREWNKID